MTTLICDAIRKIDLVNGVVRIELAETRADGSSRSAVTLAIPQSQARTVLEKLTQALADVNAEASDPDASDIFATATSQDDIGDLVSE